NGAALDSVASQRIPVLDVPRQVLRVEPARGARVKPNRRAMVLVKRRDGPAHTVIQVSGAVIAPHDHSLPHRPRAAADLHLFAESAVPAQPRAGGLVETVSASVVSADHHRLALAVLHDRALPAGDQLALRL